MKYKNEKKLGFSLVEALISMLILSIFFLASSRVITQKQMVEVQENPHGYYECYIDNGAIWQHMSISGMFTIRQNVTASGCSFTPPVGVNFFNVHYYLDGDGYYTNQQVILNERVDLGGPGGIDRPGVFNRVSPDVIDAMTVEERAQYEQEVEEGIWHFHTYLEMTHPASNIYTIWEETQAPPLEATMIAW